MGFYLVGASNQGIALSMMEAYALSSLATSTIR